MQVIHPDPRQGRQEPGRVGGKTPRWVLCYCQNGDMELAVSYEPTLDRVRRELPHMPDGEARELAAVVDRLALALGAEQIFVFGSQARGGYDRGERHRSPGRGL